MGGELRSGGELLCGTRKEGKILSLGEVLACLQTVYPLSPTTFPQALMGVSANKAEITDITVFEFSG